MEKPDADGASPEAGVDLETERGRTAHLMEEATEARTEVAKLGGQVDGLQAQVRKLQADLEEMTRERDMHRESEDRLAAAADRLEAERDQERLARQEAEALAKKYAGKSDQARVEAAGEREATDTITEDRRS